MFSQMATKRVSVQLQSDYLEKMSHVQRPLAAITELIWNGLDADATEIHVNCDYNTLGGLEEIMVSDNGHGITYEEAERAFASLGGSWKTIDARSKKKGRILHGKAGKGRFHAFALGQNVVWDTRYEDGGNVFEFRVRGSRSEMGMFEIDDKEISKTKEAGTKVRISGIERNFRSLRADEALQEITMTFALYMRQYPGLSIWYDGHKINPSDFESYIEEYSLPVITAQNGNRIKAELSVIEWKAYVERSLFLCDESGFSLIKKSPNVQAPGFNFTAYLKSSFIRELDEQGGLLLDDLNPTIQALIEAAKIKLKDHFRKRAAEQAKNLVEEWKKEDIYPYKGEPKDILEQTERQVFDVCALNLNEFLPDFDQSNKKSKRMALYLLKEAIGNSPEEVQRILQDVLDLPKEKQEELSELLKKTSLSAIINASKIVADRLNFLKGLELILFEPSLKEHLLERGHLHKILADQTWIFGEEFNLSNSDESLTKVLEKHLRLLGREPQKLEPVLREDDSVGIVDLMLSRLIPQPRADEREHLVIELKRPTKVIDMEATNQIESYALAVAKDERFRDAKTKWVFWVLSNDITDEVREKVNQRGREPGILYEGQNRNIVIWVKTWAQILECCMGRLRFYQERLEYCADHDSALSYLRRTHAKYLPPQIISPEDEKVEMSNAPN